MLVSAMQKAGTVDDVAKVKAALMKERYSGLWNIRYDDTGEAVFDFDVLHMRKGGAITATRVSPK
jgi:branched-chain amino acid transport system substrate-binding protein